MSFLLRISREAGGLYDVTPREMKRTVEVGFIQRAARQQKCQQENERNEFPDRLMT